MTERIDLLSQLLAINKIIVKLLNFCTKMPQNDSLLQRTSLPSDKLLLCMDCTVDFLSKCADFWSC